MAIVRSPEEKTYMLTTPMPKLVVDMALPSVAGMLVTGAYDPADTCFVSHLGTYATGAVGVNSSIDQIIMMACSLFAVGFTARLLCAKEDRHAGEGCPPASFRPFPSVPGLSAT